ncbi:MAG: 6-bladed beta-propeller [Candidatus Aegiribacteria sp.]|nr:6-bladed beta-propeller [Candidatus Aegiribacteria sp.]
MKPLSIMLVLLIQCAYLCGCSEPSHVLDDSTSNRSDHPVLVLSKVDSIGVELGDSNYVFGNILDAAFLPDGRILLLDVRKDQISVFSPEGEFLDSFGREGSGPGEFNEPSSIAVLSNGEICVADFMRKMLIYFDGDFNYLREVSGFTMQPPSIIEGGNGGSVVGFQTHYYTEGDELHIGSRIACWRETSTPDLEYASRYYLHDGGGSVMIPQFVYAISTDGSLYYSEISREEYKIVKLGSEGDTLFCIIETYEPTNRTEEEMAGAHFGYVLDTPGFDSNDRRRIRSSWTVDPVRIAISSIHVDGNDRIWVATGRGEQSAPQFEIYDSAGNHIFTYVTDLPAEMRFGNWRYVFGNDRVISFDNNPDDYSKVFIYEIQEQ